MYNVYEFSCKQKRPPPKLCSMMGVCIVMTAVIEFRSFASAHHRLFSPLFIGSMIEIVSRIDIVADGEYPAFSVSRVDLGSMIEMVSCIDTVR